MVMESACEPAHRTSQALQWRDATPPVMGGRVRLDFGNGNAVPGHWQTTGLNFGVLKNCR